MSGSKWIGDKALAALRNVPRLELNNLKRINRPPRGRRFPHHHQESGKGWGDQHPLNRRNKKPAIGYEHFVFPKAYKTGREKSYYYGLDAKRQYPPLSLKHLQFWIDVGILDPNEPIDLAAICNTKHFPIEPSHNHFGVNLTDEGADCFESKVNIEVQHASEATIAAVERNGGVITTAYFDLNSVIALSNPMKWFSEGKPVPRRLRPPSDALAYYTSAANRGYLAHPEQIAEERFVLAQKYGYELPEITDSVLKEIKDPRQVFYGLHPGWLINVADKSIVKPKDKDLQDYYTS